MKTTYENLYQAVKNSNLGKVNELLENTALEPKQALFDTEGNFIEPKDHGNTSPSHSLLYAAVTVGDKDIVSSVLKAGVSPEHGAVSPIRAAAQDGKLEILKLLLQKTTNLSQHKPLHIAAMNNQIEVVNYLLDQKIVQIDKVENIQLLANPDNYTALHCAARKGHLEIVEELLKRGANPIIPTSDEKMLPIHLATYSGNLKIVNALYDSTKRSTFQHWTGQQNPQLNIRDRTQRTPLHYACSEGHLEIVQFFVQKHAELNAIDTKKHTPLSEAVYYGNIKTVEYLLTQQDLNPVLGFYNYEVQDGDVCGDKKLYLKKAEKHFAQSNDPISNYAGTFNSLDDVKKAKEKVNTLSTKIFKLVKKAQTEWKKTHPKEVEAKEEEAEQKKPKAEQKKPKAEQKKPKAEQKKPEVKQKKPEAEENAKKEAKEKAIQKALVAEAKQTTTLQATKKESIELDREEIKTIASKPMLSAEELQQLKNNPTGSVIKQHQYNAEARKGHPQSAQPINTLNLLLLPEEMIPQSIKETLNKAERTKIALSLIKNCNDPELLKQFAPYEFSNPLFLAAEDGNLQVIGALKDKGILLFNSNSKTHYNSQHVGLFSPREFSTQRMNSVIIAAKNGHFKVCETLLQGAKEVDQKGLDTYIKQMFLESNSPKTIEIIEKVKDRKTALFYAAKGGHTNLVTKFLQDKTIAAEDKDKVFEAAHQNNQIEIVKYFLDNELASEQAIKTAFDYHTTDKKRSMGILHLLKTNAAVTTEMKQSVVKKTLPILNDLNKAKRFALGTEAQKRWNVHIDLIYVLEPDFELSNDKYEISSALQEEIKNQHNANITHLLHSAIKSNYYYLTNEVLFGSKKDSIDNNKALVAAIEQGALKLVKFLVEERRANINHQGDDKNTPLHHAAKAGDGAVVQYLIARGANCNATKRKKTPLYDALSGSEVHKILNKIEQGEKRRKSTFGIAVLAAAFAAVPALPPVCSALLFGTATVLASTTLTVFACATALLGIIAIAIFAVYAIDKAAEQLMYREFTKAADAIDLEQTPSIPQ